VLPDGAKLEQFYYDSIRCGDVRKASAWKFPWLGKKILTPRWRTDSTASSTLSAEMSEAVSALVNTGMFGSAPGQGARTSRRPITPS